MKFIIPTANIQSIYSYTNIQPAQALEKEVNKLLNIDGKPPLMNSIIAQRLTESRMPVTAPFGGTDSPYAVAASQPGVMSRFNMRAFPTDVLAIGARLVPQTQEPSYNRQKLNPISQNHQASLAVMIAKAEGGSIASIEHLIAAYYWIASYWFIIWDQMPMCLNLPYELYRQSRETTYIHRNVYRYHRRIWRSAYLSVVGWEGEQAVNRDEGRTTSRDSWARDEYAVSWSVVGGGRNIDDYNIKIDLGLWEIKQIAEAVNELLKG